MENGEIGEVRTKAILIDRFWVLERNVDVNGADLLIQRQLMQRDFNDPKPTKLGIVQAKFRQSLPVTIDVKEEYFLLGEKPRENFFLFVHTGTGNDKKAFFFTAADIAKQLEENSKFTVDANSKDILNTTKEVLDTMEKMLEKMDLSENYRSFLSRETDQRYYHRDFERHNYAPLDDTYKVTLPHVGSYEELANEARDEVKDYLRDYVEPLLELQEKMNASTNPVEICDLCDDFRSETGSSKISASGLNDAHVSFKEIEENAMADGLRKFCKKVREYILDDINAKNEKLYSKDFSYRITLSAKNFLDVSKKIRMDSSVVKTPEKIEEKIKSHIQEEEKRKKEARNQWSVKRYYYAFDISKYKDDQIDVTLNLSQLHAVSSIRHYQKQIAEGKPNSYINPSVELDRAKVNLLEKLTETILQISVNHVFENIDFGENDV